VTPHAWESQKRAHLDTFKEEAAQGNIGGEIYGVSELPDELPQAKHDAALPLPLQLLHWQGQQLAPLSGALEGLEAAEREEGDAERQQSVQHVRDCNEKDEDVDLYSTAQLLIPLLSCRTEKTNFSMHFLTLNFLKRAVVVPSNAYAFAIWPPSRL
jgi:hypothetical protein